MRQPECGRSIALPIIPTVGRKILEALGLPEDKWSFDFLKSAKTYAGLLDALPRGKEIAAPSLLVAKVEDAQVADWTARFGGG